jgi:hypothetical protein
MIHEGGCHCGNLRVRLNLTQAPSEVRLRVRLLVLPQA